MSGRHHCKQSFQRKHFHFFSPSSICSLFPTRTLRTSAVLKAKPDMNCPEDYSPWCFFLITVTSFPEKNGILKTFPMEPYSQLPCCFFKSKYNEIPLLFPIQSFPCYYLLINLVIGQMGWPRKWWEMFACLNEEGLMSVCLGFGLNLFLAGHASVILKSKFIYLIFWQCFHMHYISR